MCRRQRFTATLSLSLFGILLLIGQAVRASPEEQFVSRQARKTSRINKFRPAASVLAEGNATCVQVNIDEHNNL